MTGSLFVGRTRERSRLHDVLDRSLDGAGQVMFVAGEAGAGKTALLQTFTEEALQRHDGLRLAVGDCNAQGGVGDPYFRSEKSSPRSSVCHRRTG